MIIFALLFLATTTYANENLTWITSDFFTVPVSKPMSSSEALVPNEVWDRRSSLSAGMTCREYIKPAMCLVDSDELGENRPCLAGGENYARYFESLYDQYPPEMQRMFCSIRKIFVEKNFFGSAYAVLLTDKGGRTNGAMIGIRQSILDSGLTLEQWASWKEQLSFGGKTDSFVLTPGLPIVHASQRNASVNGLLYFLISHEFGHLFDFVNHINRFKHCADPVNNGDEQECSVEPAAWGAIGWLSSKTPKPENDFPGRSGLCFYDCKGHPLERASIDALYAGIARTDYISTYSTVELWQDWADSVAYFMMHEKLGLNYSIDLGNGTTYDVMARLESDRFREKRDFIRVFFARKDIVYP